MGIFSFLIPRDTRFFPLFNKVAGNLCDAVGHLESFAKAGDADGRRTMARRIKDLENQNDEVTHQIYEALHKTFITPFDREDLYQLASALDDILDVMTAAVERCDLFLVGDLTPEMVELIRILGDSVKGVAGILNRLGDLKHPEALAKEVKEIHSLENDGDAVFHRALAGLFRNGMDPLDVIRWKDLYQIVEAAIDRCEVAANVLEGISIKHA